MRMGRWHDDLGTALQEKVHEPRFRVLGQVAHQQLSTLEPALQIMFPSEFRDSKLETKRGPQVWVILDQTLPELLSHPVG